MSYTIYTRWITRLKKKSSKRTKNVPGEHSKQNCCFSWGCTFPSGHLSHLVSLSEIWLYPTGQDEHSMVLTSAEYKPELHLLQNPCPGSFW